ncbi:hypothetical protein Tco_0451131 [Tanacetum coccineum]
MSDMRGLPLLSWIRSRIREFMTLQELMVYVQTYCQAGGELGDRLERMTRRHEHDIEFDFDFDLDAAKDVSTTEKDVSTAKPVSTAGAAVTTASVAVSTAKDKDKAKMDESESKTAQTKTKMQQEQERLNYEASIRLQVELEEEVRQMIARVHEAASSFNVEEWEDIQARVEVDEELAQRLQAEEREMYIEAEQARMLVELINQRKRVHTFVPIKSEIEKVIHELAAGCLKRDAEEELDQESSKRQKTIYTKGTRKYWKITRVGNHTKVHQFFDDMLKALDRDDLVMLWSMVKERLNSTEPTNDKEREIWVKLKRLFEPDTDDEEGNIHLHAGREGISIIKRNSYIDAGCKALGRTR